MSCTFPEGCSCGASKINQMQAANEKIRTALLIAADALRTDMDIPDSMALTQCTPEIKQRRIALRMCESALG